MILYKSKLHRTVPSKHKTFVEHLYNVDKHCKNKMCLLGILILQVSIFGNPDLFEFYVTLVLLTPYWKAGDMWLISLTMQPLN